MSFESAQRCFLENTEDFNDLAPESREMNLNRGMSDLCRAFSDLEKEVRGLTREMLEMRSEIHALKREGRP